MTRILVIEDDTAHRHMLLNALEQEGYEVVEASNGKEGLKRYRQQPFDVIITDIFMPEKEGIETIIELRKTASPVKIVAISGGGLQGAYAGIPGAEIALETAKNLGADGILYKPLKIQELLLMLQKLLDKDPA